jgi:hypothetical protein
MIIWLSKIQGGLEDPILCHLIPNVSSLGFLFL